MFDPNNVSSIIKDDKGEKDKEATKTAQDSEVTLTKDTIIKGPNPDQKPANLNEQITLEEAKSGHVTEVKFKDKLKDIDRLEAVYGPGDWVKMSHSHENSDGTQIEIHWFRNKTTRQDIEFKFKVPQVLNPTEGR